MEKPDLFRQDNPKDQLTVVLMSIEGSLMNAQDGVAVEASISRALSQLALVKTLGNWLKESW